MSEDNGVSKDELSSHIHDLQYPRFLTHDKVLEELLQKVEPINFNDRSDVSASKNVPQWQQVVISIDAILELSAKYNWKICKHNGFVFIYNGAWWYNIDEDPFVNFLGDISHKLGVNLLTSRHFDFRKKLFSQFFAVADIPSQSNNVCHTKINLLNGTLVIKNTSVSLQNFNPDDFMKYQLPFAYNPYHVAPLFIKYLNRVLPSIELQNILAEYIGYVFIPNSFLKLEKTILLYGAGANGKSVFFDIINALLGSDNVSNYSLSKLTDESGYFRAMIGNKLINYASEINKKLDTSLFKQMVSGEAIEARLPYGKPFTLKNYARLIFNTNELPRDVEHSNAYFRRFIIIPFDVTIPPHERDPKLAEKIIAHELPGILNWVLKGMMRLIKNNAFTHSPLVVQQIEIYKNESDTCYLFLDENDYVTDSQNTILLKDIYTDYKSFCRTNNYIPYSKRTFKRHLESRNFKTGRKNTGIYIHIKKLIPPFSPP